MLSVTLAARQQSRCLQLALTRSAATSSNANSSSSNQNNNPFSSAWTRRSQQLLKPSLLNPKSSSTLVPANHFTTSSGRAMSGAGSDHVKMWTLEKVVSLIQIPAFIVPFLMTNPVTDAVFCTLLVLHSHWGEKSYDCGGTFVSNFSLLLSSVDITAKFQSVTFYPFSLLLSSRHRSHCGGLHPSRSVRRLHHHPEHRPRLGLGPLRRDFGRTLLLQLHRRWSRECHQNALEALNLNEEMGVWQTDSMAKK